MIHNFKYSLLIILKDKSLIFWTLAFPIILGAFFYLAFSNIENTENFSKINLTVVNADSYTKNALAYLNEKEIINLTYSNEADAKKDLNNKNIVGYLNNDILTVNSNGLNETILKYIISQIDSENKIFTDLVNEEINENLSYNYSQIYQNVLSFMNSSNVKINNITRKNISYTMIEYYTLIAMACLYGASISMKSINNLLANLSAKGKRKSVSPVKKWKFLVADFLACLCVELVIMFILYLYLIFILKVDFGNNLPHLVILTFFACCASISLGCMLSSLLKTSENAKFGILIAITMTLSFFAGMTGITMKYVIDKNVPIINIINPCNMIVDGLYSLYYYGVGNRYYYNILSLIIFTFIMMLMAINSLRRNEYDSI